MRYVVGRGRVGSALTQFLPDALSVAGRGFQGIPQLSKNDVVVVAVPDSAVAEVGQWLSSSPAVVLHCAGSVPMDALESTHRGVLYPMVSFRTPVDWPQVPVFAEASSLEAQSAIEALLRDLGASQPQWIPSDQRARYHLGAVVANNFSNHVVAILQAYCASAGLDAQHFTGMVKATTEAALSGSAQDLQTGPAARRDQATLDRHLDMLPAALRPVYQALSESIQRTAP